MTSSATQSISNAPKMSSIPRWSYLQAMTVMNGLFFSWGFVTALKDILIPQLKAVYRLNFKQAMFVQCVFFTAYLVFSLPCSRLIDKFGYKMAMSMGLFTMGVGAFLFVPAAYISSFGFFLLRCL